MNLPQGKTEQEAMNIIREAGALFTSESNVLYFAVFAAQSTAACTRGVHVTTQDHFDAMLRVHQESELACFTSCAAFEEAAALFKDQRSCNAACLVFFFFEFTQYLIAHIDKNRAGANAKR